jgi:hypothetical protein
LVDGACWPTEPTDSATPGMEVSEIPLFEVIYSGYFIPFGSPISLNRSDRVFRYWQGRCLLDGRQLGFMGLDLFKPENAGKAEYVRLCAHYRLATRQFLEYGRMLGPLEPENSVPTFTETGFGHDSSWQDRPDHYHKGTAPVAEGRLWRAEDGRLGVVLANYGDSPVDFKYQIDPGKYGLNRKSYELRYLSPKGAESIGTVTGTVERTENLAPKGIKVIEIAPAGAN